MLFFKQVTCFENLVHHALVLVVEEESGLQGLNLRLEEAEGVRVRDLQAQTHVRWQLFIRLAQLSLSMRIRAVLAKVTLLVLLEILANLSLVVVVRDVEHFVLHFDWQLLYKLNINAI